jgi:hypothetical protein
MNVSNRKEENFHNHNSMAKINIEKNIDNNNNSNNKYNREIINNKI